MRFKHFLPVAEAFIDFTTLGTIQAAGDISVRANDAAGIFANSKIVVSSITTNDGGANLANDTLADLLPADFSSTDGQQSISFAAKWEANTDSRASQGLRKITSIAMTPPMGYGARQGNILPKQMA